MIDLGKYNIILASKSPRRKELLTKMGIKFQVIPSTVKEDYGEEINPYLVPEFLAEKKAHDVFQNLKTSNNSIVIGADSVVILKDRIFEKPNNEDEAFSMLAHLSGKQHHVITGICLLSSQKKMTFSGKSAVTFRPMDKDEIHYYIRQGKPFDKAGGYGIQDWIGMCKVSSIEGTYTNIVGLPTDLVYEGLRSMIQE